VYDAEMHLQHVSNDERKVVTVVVFLKSSITFSYSQTFFEELFFSSLKDKTNFPIQVSEEWTPYTIIPPNKAFFIYRGGLIPLSATETCGTADKEYVWLVMESHMDIHQKEFSFLKEVSSNGKNQKTYELFGRKIYYNNGDYVSGNSKPGQIYVKCTKSNNNFSLDSFKDEKERVVDGICYKNESDFMNIVLYLFIAIFLLILFNYDSKFSKDTNTDVNKFIILVFSVFLLIYLMFTFLKLEKLLYVFLIFLLSVIYSGYVKSTMNIFNSPSILLRITAYVPAFFLCLGILYWVLLSIIREPKYRVAPLNSQSFIYTISSILNVELSYFQIKRQTVSISKFPMALVRFLGMPYIYGNCGIILNDYIPDVEIEFLSFLAFQYNELRKKKRNAVIAFQEALMKALRNQTKFVNLREEEIKQLETNYAHTSFKTDFPELYNKFKLPDLYELLN
jgi:hypothetical protein